VTTGIAARLFILGWALAFMLCLVINSHVKNRRPPGHHRCHDLRSWRKSPTIRTGHHVRDRPCSHTGGRAITFSHDPHSPESALWQSGVLMVLL